MSQLEPEAYAKFNQMLDELSPEVDKMKDVPREFMRDMLAKNKEYGERMFVSPKQVDWVKRLHEEFVGDTDFTAEDDEPSVEGDPRDRDGW